MNAARRGAASVTPEQKRQNLRLALILASVSLAFCVGFVLKLVALGT
jgi:hypothetical protein